MRVRTLFACAMLAWAIVLAVVLTAGISGPTTPPPQATTATTPSTTQIRTTAQLTTTAPITPARPAAAAARAARARYVIQPGDTLSRIAARLGVPGGWPALYAANQPVIGPDPGLIHPGTVLVLPGRAALTRYTVTVGDTLSAIAAALRVRGGWPALYAANQPVIGPDPGLIHPGTVLTLPGQPAPPPPAASRPAPAGQSPAPAPTPTPAPAPGSSHRHHHPVTPPPTPAASGLPSWLKTVLLAAGLITAAAFLTEPLLLARRRRARAARRAAASLAAGPGPGTQPARPAPADGEPGVLIADYHRIIVSYNQHHDTATILRPPGEDPRAIMSAARLILPERRYAELAEQLRLPASWPIIMADYHRVVVTCNQRDDTAYVLRPPGEDPRVVLRAARLVLPEGAYAELADQLGTPAGWPLEQA
jgi:LysM repeat protein